MMKYVKWGQLYVVEFKYILKSNLMFLQSIKNNAIIVSNYHNDNHFKLDKM